jgi:GT2 family glycosyltransferase
MADIQTRAKELSIIIVNYNTPDLVQSLLTALTSNVFEIIVVDNSPTKALERTISTLYPQVIYLPFAQNVGFAGGVNAGIQKSTKEWVLLVNTDTTINSEQINELVEAAQKSKAEVAAPQLITGSGMAESSVGYFDSFMINPINVLFARPRLVNPDTINATTQVDTATGGVLLIKKSVFKEVGMFDDKNFFMYFEDIDFSLRLKQKAIPILFVPTVQIKHSGGKSSDQSPDQKNTNYQKSLNNYLLKHRGRFILMLNTLLGVLK